jgi:RIO kinase 1
VPRFRIIRSDASDRHGDQHDRSDDFDGSDDFDDLHDHFDDQGTRRRRRPAPVSAPRLVLEGKSGRTLVDSDVADDAETDPASGGPDDSGGWPDAPSTVPYSSYDVATHGPKPVPDWLVTSLSAKDTRLGIIKTGKEADVALLDRSLPGGPGCLLAVKTFRSADHRMFHRDAGYLEGRRVRRSRETRAMATKTSFGRELLAGRWANAEFASLSAIWKAGARVPYPVQVIGSELMMEFIGEPDGTAAPRLAAFDATTSVFTDLWHDLVSSLEVLAQSGLTHGDLSPYNVLVDEQGCVVIDLPQVVDLVANPQGAQFLDRDCRNIADFFARRGVLAADPETLALHLMSLARP